MTNEITHEQVITFVDSIVQQALATPRDEWPKLAASVTDITSNWGPMQYIPMALVAALVDFDKWEGRQPFANEPVAPPQDENGDDYILAPQDWGVQIPLPQLEVAHRLASGYGHEWGSPVVGCLIKLGAKLSPELIARGVRATSENIWAGINAPSWGGSMPWVLSHKTGTGRLMWEVLSTGAVHFTVSRPSGAVLKATVHNGVGKYARLGPFGYRHIEALRHAVCAVSPNSEVLGDIDALERFADPDLLASEVSSQQEYCLQYDAAQGHGYCDSYHIDEARDRLDDLLRVQRLVEREQFLQAAPPQPPDRFEILALGWDK